MILLLIIIYVFGIVFTDAMTGYLADWGPREPALFEANVFQASFGGPLTTEHMCVDWCGAVWGASPVIPDSHEKCD